MAGRAVRKSQHLVSVSEHFKLKLAGTRPAGPGTVTARANSRLRVNLGIGAELYDVQIR
jgi:hypothetical protein